jgi:hypothetical protein
MLQLLLFSRLVRWGYLIGLCLAMLGCGGQGTPERSATGEEDSLVAGLLTAPITEAQAVKFLWKSSFGPTAASVARLRQLGYARFVDEQLALSAGSYSSQMLTDSITSIGDEGQRRVICAKYPQESWDACHHWIYATPRAPSIIFLKSAVHDQDQLRLRVAWALSQILVVSTHHDQSTSHGMRSYQQMLRTHALGNYKTILSAVAKHPMMGNYLDMVSSKSGNPNQNFARELLQLFSVGTYARNQDGSFVVRAGRRVENYTQKDVLEFSRALTGWIYAPVPGFSETNPHWFNYAADMLPSGASHDSGAKTLLNGQAVPGGRSASEELEMVINNVFSHSSTGPNIVVQLIKFLVSSNPSSAYVSRVVKVWNNNGRGVAGDMKAVVRAILLDIEALNSPDVGGKLLEPAIAMPGLVRAVGGQTDGAFLDLAVAEMEQRPFAAPSVFNFYPPDFLLPKPGSRREAPQFGILSMTSLAAKVNHAHTLIFQDVIPRDTSLPLSVTSGTRLIWPSHWIALARNQVPLLVNTLNAQLAGGALTAAQVAQIVSKVSALPGGSNSSDLNRLRMAVWLIFSSPQFMTHK